MLLIDSIVDEVLATMETDPVRVNEWGEVMWTVPQNTYSRLSMAIQMGKTGKYTATASFGAPISIETEKVKILVYPFYLDS